MSDYKFDVNELLSDLFITLNSLFNKRIQELNISPTNALEIIGIEYRALNGILNGTSKRIDYTNFIKLATFLNVPIETVFKLYLDELEKQTAKAQNNEAYPPEKINFINSNFDLVALRKAGLIKNITDYIEVEEKIVSLLELKSIYEYAPPKNDVAFSSGLIKPKNNYSRNLWISKAIKVFKKLNNPHDYDRNTLRKYFPEIRKNSMDVENGLIKVIRNLFKLGITVIYQSPLSSLHLRGATMNINGKPCIVLTDYRGFYPTLWFALIHELSHVLFDFNEIKLNSFHISENANFNIDIKEEEANKFAREFLFSSSKLEEVKPHLTNEKFITKFAEKNHVHPSFIYLFYAYDLGNDNNKAWERARKSNPDFQTLISQIDNPWNNLKPTKDFIKNLKEKVFN